MNMTSSIEHLAGKLFHFDDSPEEIINIGSGARTFSAYECQHVRARVEEMFSLEGFDPFALAVELSE